MKKYTNEFKYDMLQFYHTLNKRSAFSAWMKKKIKYYNFIQNKDFIILKKKYRSKINYFCTEETYRCIKNSELKLMPSIEKQYINILYFAFFDGEPVKQYKIENYRVDLFLKKYNICIECDEENHKNYNQIKEQHRIEFLRRNYTVFQFDPCIANFNIGNIINQIRLLIPEEKIEENFDIKNNIYLPEHILSAIHEKTKKNKKQMSMICQGVYIILLANLYEINSCELTIKEKAKKYFNISSNTYISILKFLKREGFIEIFRGRIYIMKYPEYINERRKILSI